MQNIILKLDNHSLNLISINHQHTFCTLQLSAIDRVI